MCMCGWEVVGCGIHNRVVIGNVIGIGPCRAEEGITTKAIGKKLEEARFG